MFHSNTNGEGFDTDGSTLAAGLLTSAAVLSNDPGHQCRRNITAYITACIAASRFISFKETTYYYEINNSFSSRSSRDEETSSSSCDRVSESPVNLSTPSQVAIDIPSDNEAEEKNEEQLLLRNKAAQIVEEERNQISLAIDIPSDNEVEENNGEQPQLRNKVSQMVKQRDLISLAIDIPSDNEVEEKNEEQLLLRNKAAQIVEEERDQISLVIDIPSDNEAEEKNEEQLLLRNKAAQIVEEERDQISLAIDIPSDNEVEENNGEQPQLRNKVSQMVKQRDLISLAIDIPSDNEVEEKNEEQLLLRNKAAQIVEEKRDQISLVIDIPSDNEAEEKNEEQLLLRNKAAQIVEEERDQLSHAIDVPSDNEVEENNGEQPQLRNKVAQIVKERDLISLKIFGGVEKVAPIFDSDLESGIRNSIQEPEVRNSYRDSNPIHTKEFVFFLLNAGNNYTIFLLVVSAGLSFGTEIMEEGPKYGWHDGVVILAAVSMLIAFPSVANFRRAKKLEKERNKLNVTVVRRQEKDITISNLVPGDIVCLKKGDLVPADGLVVRNNGLELDGVLNSKIDHDRNPFLFFGSKVKEGNGYMLATSVGDQTELAELLSSTVQEPIEKILLEDQIEKINTYVENLSLSVSIFISSVAFIRLLCRRNVGVDNEFPELKGNVSVDMLMKIFEKIVLKPQGKVSVLTSALTVVVIAIQHGMPFVITISLSCWNSKMVKNHAGPQNLSACAAMGTVTVMFIDATGGLVCKDLEVSRFYIGGKDLKNDMDSDIDPAVTNALEQVMRGIRASHLAPAISAIPAYDSLISWANSRWGMDREFVDQNLPILVKRKLSSNKRCCGILTKNNGDDEEIFHTHWSGAASTILNMCSHYYESNGTSLAIHEGMRKQFEQDIKDMERSGLRSMAFSCRQTKGQEIQEDGLYLLALAGVKYQCSEEIKAEVEAFKKAGLRIKLVSEEEPSAPRAIACELGIIRSDSDELALELEQIQDLESPERMEKVTVMGNFVAEGKLLLVQYMQKKGDVVAFFGGSLIGNTPALKTADVGITEDTLRTMASESSDIIIKAIGSLSTGLKFGRCAYHNIKKFSQLQLTVCISGLLITMVTTISLKESSLTALQLIWVNWITCILGGLMMVMELQVEELIANPPANRTKSLLTKVMWKNIALQVLCQASVLLIFRFKGQVIPGMNQDVRKAMIFSSFTISQVFNLFYAMNLVKKEVFLSVLRNFWFLLALVTVMVLQVLVAEYLESLADCVRLNWIQWSVCFLLAALPCCIHIAVEFISHFAM